MRQVRYRHRILDDAKGVGCSYPATLDWVQRRGTVVRVAFQWRVAGVFALTVITLGFAVASAVRLWRELAVCFVPVEGPVLRPLCSELIWGHGAVPVALLAAAAGTVVVGAVLAIATACSQLTGAARFRRQLVAAEAVPDARVDATAAGLGIRMRVVACPIPLAVTVGVSRPEVLLSDALAAKLSDEELAAVLHHEAWHVRGRHPISFALIRALAQAGALIPALSSWADRAVLQAEVDADQAAVQKCGRPAFLGALAKLAEEPDPMASTGAAFGSARGMLADRVRVLAGRPPAPTLSLADVGLSLVGLAIIVTPMVSLAVAIARASG